MLDTVVERIKYYIEAFGPAEPEDIFGHIHTKPPELLQHRLTTALFAGDLVMDGLGRICAQEPDYYTAEPVAVTPIADYRAR